MDASIMIDINPFVLGLAFVVFGAVCYLLGFFHNK